MVDVLRPKLHVGPSLLGPGKASETPLVLFYWLFFLGAEKQHLTRDLLSPLVDQLRLLGSGLV